NNSIGENGTRALAEALKTNSTLTTLGLRNNSIGENGTRALAEALKTNSTLTTLGLRNNSIGENGTRALAEALKTNSTLTTLGLRNNSIGENGTQALAEALRTNSTLTTLDLENNLIGDKIAKELTETFKTRYPKVLAKAASESPADTTFQLLYFPFHGRAELTIILVLIDAKTEPLVVDWPAMKQGTRFGVLAVLYETSVSGTILKLAESTAIERYLSKKSNLLGSNAWEEHLLNEYYNSSDALANYYSKVVFSTPENRHKEAETFYSARFSRAAAHETHLQEYFNLGHFVGVAFTLADMRTTQVMQLLKLMLPSGIEFPALPAGLAKLIETVETEPRIAA
ncbi:hypothetical protein BG005_001315, partial [Podila minutissima]